MFYRYTSKVKKYFESLEESEAAKFTRNILQFEKLDFMENSVNDLIATYKVRKILLILILDRAWSLVRHGSQDWGKGLDGLTREYD